MKRLTTIIVLVFCINVFVCNAHQIINHTSYTLVDDYLKSFEESQNDVTFIFKGSGWNGKTFILQSPKRLLGEFKKDLFKELSFNMNPIVDANPGEIPFSLEVLDASASYKEIKVDLNINPAKGKFIVLYWEGANFSVKAYKNRIQN